LVKTPPLVVPLQTAWGSLSDQGILTSSYDLQAGSHRSGRTVVLLPLLPPGPVQPSLLQRMRVYDVWH
jgi:hypothetical protein